MRIGTPEPAERLRDQFSLVGRVDLDVSSTVIPVVDVGPSPERAYFAAGVSFVAGVGQHGCIGILNNGPGGLVHVTSVLAFSNSDFMYMHPRRTALTVSSGAGDIATGRILSTDMRQGFRPRRANLIEAGVLIANLPGGSVAAMTAESVLVATVAGVNNQILFDPGITLLPRDRVYFINGAPAEATRAVFFGYSTD